MLAALMNLGFAGSGVVSTVGVSSAFVATTGRHTIDHVRRRRDAHTMRISASALGDGLELDESGNISVIGPSGLWTITAVKTSAYTADYDELVRADPSAGTFAVTLPTASGVAGRQLTIKNVTSSTVNLTLTPNGSETVDGLSSVTMAIGFESLTLVSDGTNWIIL